MACNECPHDFHSLDDCSEDGCLCGGDMEQAREDWELNNWKAAREAQEDRWDAGIDAIWES